MDVKHFYTVCELALIAGISDGAVYRLIAKGEIDAQRVGKRGPHRIRRASIADFLGCSEVVLIEIIESV